MTELTFSSLIIKDCILNNYSLVSFSFKKWVYSNHRNHLICHIGISRDSFHKRRNTGGKRVISTKKRQYLCGRQPAHTKLLLQSTKHHQTKVVHTVRCRGGNLKYRALRLSAGNFSWGTEGIK